MKFIANENFPRASFILLKEKGIDIQHIGDTFAGITDAEVMGFSQQENRIIITFDADYGELVFKKGYSAEGVIYLRFQEFSPEVPGQIILDLLAREDINLEGYFTVVDEGKLRQRKI